ncbi:MAG: M56 family metallopeptidase, partial [Planctomycetota bacterium]
GRAAPRVVPVRALAEGLWWGALARLALPPSIASPFGLVPGASAAAAGIEGASTASGASAPGASVFVWTAAVTAVWASGFAAALLAAFRTYRFERLAWPRSLAGASAPDTRDAAARAARAVGLRSAPCVRVFDAAPACVGLRAPWISIPPELERQERARDLEVVLLHECAHLARRDGLRRAVVVALGCVFWFHPVPHLARRRLDALAEFACDRAAARRAAGGAEACRAALVRAALAVGSAGRGPALGFQPRRSMVRARLRALAAPELGARPAPALGFAAALALVGGARTAEGLAPSDALVPPAAAPLAAPLAQGHPPFDALEGCLQKRYVVLAALAQSPPAADAAPKR